MMIYWENVKRLIKENNTTQEWVAGKAGVSVAVFRNWIYHNRFPNTEKSIKIAKALNTTVEYLVTGEKKIRLYRENSDIEEICNSLVDLSEKQIAEIKGVVNNYIETHFQERDPRQKTRA